MRILRIISYSVVFCSVLMFISWGYHRKGDFQTSLEYLDQIDVTHLEDEKMLNGKIFKGICLSLRAYNLMFLGEKDASVSELFAEASIFFNHPTIKIPRAAFEASIGNHLLASRLFREYQEEKDTGWKYKLGFISFFVEKEFQYIHDQFMTGLYFKHLDEFEQAKKHFQKATLCKQHNYYVEEAKNQLKLLA